MFTRSRHTGPTAASLVHTKSVRPQSHRPPRYSPAVRVAGGRQNMRNPEDRPRAWCAGSAAGSGTRTRPGAGPCTRRRAAKSTSMTLAPVPSKAAARVAEPADRRQRKERKDDTLGTGVPGQTGVSGATSLVSAIAVVGLEREVLEKSLLGLPEGDRAQHLLGLLGERDRGDHAGQLGRGELGDRGLHRGEDLGRKLPDLDSLRDGQRVLEAARELLLGFGPLLGRAHDAQLLRRGVEEAIESLQEGVSSRHLA